MHTKIHLPITRQLFDYSLVLEDLSTECLCNRNIPPGAPAGLGTASCISQGIDSTVASAVALILYLRSQTSGPGRRSSWSAGETELGSGQRNQAQLYSTGLVPMV